MWCCVDMHLVETFASTLGARIGPVDIRPSFYPILHAKYATISPFSKNSKNYSHWGRVLEILAPVLKDLGMPVLQLGGKDEPPLPGCQGLAGQTTLRQAAHVVKGSSLHLCADTFTGHLSCFFGVPTVVLISNNLKGNVIPYFRDDAKTAVFEPDRFKWLPSYSYDDPDRQIDTISPEDVAAAAARLLGKTLECPRRLLYTGPLSRNTTVESCPNAVVDVGSLGIPSIVVRMDYLHDEGCLTEQLRVCPCNVVSRRPIDRRILEAFAGRIERLYYLVDEGHDPAFPRMLAELGIKFALFSHMPESWIQDRKVDYCDHGCIFPKGIPSHSSIDEVKMFHVEQLEFRSSKFILSGGKVYPSKVHWLRGEYIDGLECPFLPVVDDPGFWVDVESCQVFLRSRK